MGAGARYAIGRKKQTKGGFCQDTLVLTIRMNPGRQDIAQPSPRVPRPERHRQFSPDHSPRAAMISAEVGVRPIFVNA